MYSKIFDSILNKKEEQQFYIGTISATTPTHIELITNDTPIPYVTSSSLINVQAGSRIVLLKYLNKFIGLCSLGETTPETQNKIEIVTLSSAEYFSDTTLVNTNLKFNFDGSSTYLVESFISAAGDSSAGIKLDWEVTSGTIPSNQTRKGLGMAFGETDRGSSKCRLNQSYLTTNLSYGVDTYPNYIKEDFLLTTTTDGELTLRAAKQVATGGNTSIASHSFLKIIKIS